MKFPNKSSIIFLSIIIVLISALVVTQCSKDKIEQSGNSGQLEKEVAIEKARVIELANIEQHLRSKIKQDSVKNLHALQDLKIENKDLRKKIVPVRKEVEKIADTVAIVKQYLGLTDSLDVIQDSTIQMLSMEKVRMWNNFNELLSVADQKFKASNELVTHYETLNKDLERKYKRERLKKNGWKIIAGILGVGIVAQSLDVF